jgi:hypothetical protein
MADNFALSPGLVDHADIINYRTREGQKLYEMAIKSLKDEYNLDHGGLQGFLEQLGDRAKTSGWTDISHIPPDINNIHDVVNLITRYGGITLEQVRAHAATYVNGHNRAAQDSMQMYQCIFNTLTKEAQAVIALNKADYTIGEGDGAQVSGTCLLKVVIRKSQVDTNATTSHILTQLGRIDKIVTDLNSNIVKVNEKVKALVEELAARGETTSHLLNNLFEGYKVASDKEFVSYIKKKRDEYNDSTTPMEPDTLMYQAANYYITSVEAGEWERPSQAEEQIIALEAQVKELEANAANYNASQQGSSAPRARSSPAGNARNVKPAWMTEPPKSDDPQMKIVNGKEYHWCPNHQAWVRHLPSKCEGKGIKPSANKPAPSSPHRDDEGPKQLKLSNALTALVEQDDEGEDIFP